MSAPDHPDLAAAKAVNDAPWTAQIAEIAVEGGEATLLDLATHVLDDEPARPIGVQELMLKVSGIDWDGLQLRKPLPVQLAATLRRPDATRRNAREVPKFRWEGQLALTPLKASGRLSAEHLPLHWVDPYLDPSIGIHLQRAEGSMRGGFEFTETPKGPSVSAGGELLISDLRLRQARLQDGRRRSAEDLLSWQGLKLGALRLALAPRRLVYLRHNVVTAVSLVLPALRVLRVSRFVRVLRATRAVRGVRLARVVSTANRGMRALGTTVHRRGLE